MQRGQRCRSRSGAPRRLAHLRRGLVALTAELLTGNAARLPVLDRLILATYALPHLPSEQSHLGSPVETGAGDQRLRLDQIHWLTESLARALDDRNAALDLAGLVEASRQLHKDVEKAVDAAELWDSGEVATHLRNGWPRPVQPTPEQASELHAVHQTEQVCELARRRAALAPSPSARAGWSATWDCEEGWFSAHPEQYASLMVSGWAPCLAVAEDVLAGWTVPGGARPAVRWATEPDDAIVRRPPRRWAYARSPRAEISEFILRDDTAVAAFEQAASRAREALTGQAQIPAYLAARAAELNRRCPPPVDRIIDFHIRDARRVRHPELHGSSSAFQWIPNPHTVVVAGGGAWGDFASHRPGILPLLAGALAGATDLRAFLTDRLYGTEPLDLQMVPGPAGPIFEVASNGLHRSHLARMLELPIFAVTGYRPLPPRITAPVAIPNQLTPLWRGLIRRGLLDGDLDLDSHGNGTLTCYRITAAWFLNPPQHATLINRAYEHAYPGALTTLGIPAAALCDPDAWTAWLLHPDSEAAMTSSA